MSDETIETTKGSSYMTHPGITQVNPAASDILDIIDEVIEQVFNVESSELRTKARQREITVPRQTYMALLVDFANREKGINDTKGPKEPKELANMGMKLYYDEFSSDPGYGLKYIGKLFGITHSTVLHAHRIIREDWWMDKHLGYGEKVRTAYTNVKRQLNYRFKQKGKTIS